MMKKLIAISLVAAVLLSGLWLFAFKPDGPPPNSMMDLLAASSDVNEVRQLVEAHFKATRGFEGVEKLRLPAQMTRAEILRSIEVEPGGSIIAKVAVRAKPSGKSTSDGREIVTLTWSPSAASAGDGLQWRCTGVPSDYVPQGCRQ